MYDDYARKLAEKTLLPRWAVYITNILNESIRLRTGSEGILHATEVYALLVDKDFKKE